MKLFIATALLATLGLAAPVTETEPKTIAAREAFSCSSGLTNSSPMCCGANVLGVLALDCKTRTVSPFFSALLLLSFCLNERLLLRNY